MKVITTPAHESIWDEARRILAEWEKAEHEARNLVLILDGKNLVVQLAGAGRRTSDVAGLCFSAAQLVVERDI